MGMQHLFPHLLGFSHHNRNRPWISQINMAGGSNIRHEGDFLNVWLMEQDMAGSSSHNCGMATWQAICGVCNGTLCDLVMLVRCMRWKVWNSATIRLWVDFARNAPIE